MSLTLITALAIGVAILLGGGVLLLGLVNALSSTDEVGERIQTYALVPDLSPTRGRTHRRDRLLRLRLRFNSMLSVVASEELNLKLMSANWPITPTEFVVIRIGVTFVALVLGTVLLNSIISGIGLGVITYLVPGILLQNAIRMRRTKFEHQLVDVLVLITGAVRAGYSFLQALDVVVNEMDDPASVEFRRVRREVGLGLPLSQALTNLSDRMENDDLYLAVTAININSQVGGNLTTMLEAVTETIRERMRLFSEIRAMTAQQRYSAYLLTLLPFFMGAILFIINPEYMSRLSEVLCIPIGAAINVLLGNLIISRMTKIEV